MKRETTQRQATAVGTGLTNNPCRVRMTIQFGESTPEAFVIENEADARNLLARMVPTSVIASSPAQVLPFITDESQPLFNYFYNEGVAHGLSMPAGVGSLVTDD